MRIKNAYLLPLILLPFVFNQINLFALEIDSTLSQKNFFKNVSCHGSIGVNNLFYATNSSNPQRSPYSYQFYGAATINAYGISLPFSFVLSEQNRSYSQPFNQFGISPKYKWIKVHLGYRNLNYSSFTLGGYNFLGYGIDLNPGKFRFSFMQGRFSRLTNNPNDTISYPSTYLRKGTGAKIGVGSSTNYFDFIFFRAKDNYKNQAVDSLTGSVTPGENTVLGANCNFLFAKYFSISGDYAISLHTKDILAEDYFGYEDTLQNYAGSLSNYFTLNSTTRFYNALQINAGFDKKIYSLKINARRIDPGYISFGTYYFQDDIQTLTINPAFQLFKSKFIFNGSIGLQQDNLSNQKTETTNKLIGSANLNINPKPHYGISMQYINYTTGQRSNIVQANDTLYQGYVSTNISVMPRYSILGKKLNHNFFVLGSYQKLFDENPYTATLTNFDNYVLNASYNVAIAASKSGYTITLQQIENKTSSLNYNLKGVALGYSKLFLKERANFYTSVSENFNYLNGVYSYNSLMINSSCNIRVKSQHSFNTICYFIFNDKPSSNDEYQFNLQLAYTYNF